ncbi:MAG: alpha/beta hydrolase [Actinomycetota bacterium]|nr:alpha/beta hydrolase [Actinomycetota bacterium]
MSFADLRDRAGPELARLILQLPDGVLRTLAPSPPLVAAGLDPQAWALARLSDVAAPAEAPSDLESRRLNEIRCAVMGRRPETPVASQDLTAGGVPSRLYVPQAAAASGPLLVFFHGGGWVQGSVQSHDAACRTVADRAGVRVLSVDYRLAPEHVFPAAFDDCLAAYLQVAEQPEGFGARAGEIAVGGDSAGGNLAAAVALHARDAGLPVPALQWLLYPVCDVPDHHESYRTYAEGFYLGAERMRYLFERYVPNPTEREDLRVSPLRAGDLSGLPGAFVAISLADPLRDEGEAYARRLEQAGVAVELRLEPLLHGFLNTTALSSGRAGALRAADGLRRGLARAAERG